VVPPLDVTPSTRPEPEARAGQGSIDPQAREVTEYLAQLGLPPIDKIPPAEARRQYREARAPLRPPAPDLPDVRDLKAVGKGGPIALRLYRPAEGTLPAFVYFHGGGWVVGDLDTHDVVCRQIARAAGAAVIAVDYRLAPEHPFPAASDDAWSATTWIAAHAGDLGIDPSRIAVGGDSAGGGLAAVVALMARDSQQLRVALQVLVYPVLDLRAESASYSKYAEGYLLTRAAMKWYIAQYAPAPQAVNDWHASPLLAPWVHGVAPALIITAEMDPLVDEGDAYARRLRGARVPVDYQVVPGMIHGFLPMGGKIDAANRALADVASALRQAFTRASV
jgi:acetyl esterase